MKNINELLDAAKIGASLPSDYALAKAIDRPNGHIANIRSGRRWPSRTDTLRLADLIGIESAELHIAIEAMRSGDPTLIASAQRMLQKLHSKAAGIGGFCMGFQALNAADDTVLRLHYILC